MKNISRISALAGALSICAVSMLSSAAQQNVLDNGAGFQKPGAVPDSGILGKRERMASPIQLKEPGNIKEETSYDHKSGTYTTVKKAGGIEIGRPWYVSAAEHDSAQSRNEIREYWRRQMMENYSLDGKNSQSGLSRYLNPRISVNLQGFDRIFGSNIIDIKPQGNVEVSVGVDISKIDNFTLPKKQRNDVSFDFDMALQVGVTGTIGDKMKVGINYNTESTFEFENEQKVEYNGHSDEIIQRIEFGNVSMPLSGTLIQGSTTLFGVKTDLKFGRLSASAILSQQKGETKTIEVNAGAVQQEFSIQASDYEANRHFFLNHYFRSNYEPSLKNLPTVTSGITVTKIEVWVTNSKLSTTDTRNSVAFLDLGEPEEIYNTSAVKKSSQKLPSNAANTLYSTIVNGYKAVRDINSVTSTLGGRFVTGTDYEKIGNARMLQPSEYSFNPQLGFISLNSALQDDEVLAVAYEYTYKGKTYKVGEFSSEVSTSEALILKLLRGTAFSPALPNWRLMMKNVYSLNAYQVQQEDFQLQIKYRNDKTGTDLNYLEAGDISGQMLIKVFGLDNANSKLERMPDGVFDFVEGVTINPEKAKIYLPQLEPFGSYLAGKIGDPADAARFSFPQLYDSTKTIAKQNAEKDKFYIEGTYKSSSGSEISLNAMNIEEGSVKVTCGGLTLNEGTDYVVDYLLGSVKIVNESILQGGSKILVSVESNTTFNSTTKSLMGTHLNYQFSDNFNIGGTVMRLSEKTMTNKVSVGSEPIKNTIWGLDARYSAPVPFLTALVDKLPFVSTAAESRISLEGEFAQLLPGHSRSVDKAGTCYIDDFESAQTKIDVKSMSKWVLASTPAGTNRFREASFSNDLRYGYNRALLSWYNVLSDLQGTSISGTGITPGHITRDDQSNHYIRAVYEREIFPNAQSVSGVSTQLTVLNMAYYPEERGPYNFDVEGEPGISSGISAGGKLNNPGSRWGGIMRELSTTDFETSNIEYLEFWMLDPFIYEQDGMGADLYFNLGHVSEDVLKDSRKSFENGIPYPMDSSYIDTTAWGLVSTKTFLVNAFDNTNGAKEAQDKGFDGLGNDEERAFHQDYLTRLAKMHGTSSQAYQQAYADPSADDYHYFRGNDYDEQKLSIEERYKHYNGSEGNSSDVGSTSSYSTIKDRYPDVEDINLDNTLSETESYYQYKVRLKPGEMRIGQNYITDIVESNVKTVNGEQEVVKWYQFKVPIYEPDSTIGPISDFKSIRFLRMYLTNAKKNIILRFAEMNLVRGDWRKYNATMTEAGEFVTDTQFDQGILDITNVGLEENGSKQPVNYLLPPGIERERDYMTNQIVEQDEKAMALHVTSLPDGQAVAAYKSAKLDLRQYKKMKMFVHAEEKAGEQVSDGDLHIFVRLGSDYKENYYEYEMPVSITPEGLYADDDNGRLAVWPPQNNVEIVFEQLQLVKQQRNNAARQSGASASASMPFSVENGDGSRITIMGNPNVSNIRTIMIGVRNPSQSGNTMEDDGLQKSAEIWVNELRLTDFDEDGGWAARGKAELQLADLATVSISGYMHTPGFGSIEKKVSERYQETVYQYDINTLVQMGKFFSSDYNVRMPLYYGFSESYELPKYNPLDPDIELTTTLKDPSLSQEDKDEVRQRSITFERRKSLNLTNIHIDGRSDEAKSAARLQKALKNNPDADPESIKPEEKKQRQKPFFHVSNFTGGFAYSEFLMHDITVQNQLDKTLQTSLEYNYTYNPKNYKPFSNIGFLKYKSLALIRDFNFYLLPTMVSFNGNIDRNSSVIQYRNVNSSKIALDPTYRKDFNWTRRYEVRYKLSQNLRMDFSASNESRVNPDGKIDTYALEKSRSRDTIFMRFFDLGYNTRYNQSVKFNWQTPINKIPGLGWTSLTAIYNADYEWNRGTDPLQVGAGMASDAYTIDYGNSIANSATLTLNGSLNLERLYKAVPYFKNVMARFTKDGRKKASQDLKEVSYTKSNVRFSGGTPRSISHNLGTMDVEVAVTDIDGKPVDGDVDIIDKNRLRFTSSEDLAGCTVLVTGKKEASDSPFLVASDYITMALLSVRNISISYKNQRASTIPGFSPESKFFGMEKSGGCWAPGFSYIMGLDDDGFHETAAERGWLVKDTTMADPVHYTKGNNLGIRLSVEPINTLRVDVSLDRTMLMNTEDYYYWTGSQHQSTSKIESGNFRMSFNMLKTAFRRVGSDYSLDVYSDFLASREVVASRLANGRRGQGGYTGQPQPSNGAPQAEAGYPDGYSGTHQDVMLPAFLAAYAGTSPEKVSTSPFPKIPLPNWNVRYKGLGNIPLLKEVVRSALLSHSYQCTYSVSNFKSNANFNFYDEAALGNSFERYEANRLFIPKYEIGSVTLEERFNPLFGMDISWVSMLSTKLEYRRQRLVTLSFANAQISEAYKREWVIGLGYKFAQLPFSIKTASGSKRTKSDLDLRCDFVINNDKTILREIEDLYNEISAGQTSFSLKTTADYQVSQRFKVRFYYNHAITNPLISTSYRTANIKFGFTVSMSLD